MKAFQETTSQTLERLNVDPGLGLSKNQIEESRLKHGVNAFTKGKPKSRPQHCPRVQQHH